MIGIAIKDFLDRKDFRQLKKFLNEQTPADIAEFMEENRETAVIIFRLLNKEVAAEAFAHLDSDEKKIIVESISDHNLKEFLEELFFDDMIDFLEEMPSNVVKRVLKNSNPKNRVLINQFLAYEDDTAGSLMTIEYLSIKKEWTVEKSISYIRKNVMEVETVDVAYVTDKNKKLEGEISLKEILSAKDDERIEELMEKDILSVNTWTNQEQAIELFKKYDLTVLPVIDREEILVGIITIDDVVDAIEEENTEDFQKMAAMQPSKDEYLDTPVFNLAKNRLLWLLVLMVSATFTGAIISQYEEVIQGMVVLAASIPMLMDTGGNAGSQSSTLIIRGMALGEVKISDYLKVIWKELRVSLIVGLGLGSVNFIRMSVLMKQGVKVSFLVSFTLGITVVIAKLVGGLLPIGAKKLKLDPAIMAGPLVTTIVDALALVIYFSLAVFMFPELNG